MGRPSTNRLHLMHDQRQPTRTGASPMPNQLTALWAYLRIRCGAAGGWDEAGTVVEKVILTAIFAALAIAVGGGPAAGVASARSVLTGPGSDVTGSAVVVSVLPGESEWLQVTGQAVSVVPGLSFTVSASAIGPIQQFRGSE